MQFTLQGEKLMQVATGKANARGNANAMNLAKEDVNASGKGKR